MFSLQDSPFTLIEDLKQTVATQVYTSGGMILIIDQLFEQLYQYCPDDLFNVMATINPDRSFYLSGHDTPRRFIDLIINFLGYVTYFLRYDHPLNINNYPSFQCHQYYEKKLVNLFANNPRLVCLMYMDSTVQTSDNGGSIDQSVYNCTQRDDYSQGLNWRMFNLILTGYFRLYQSLLNERIQRSHFYYLLVLTMYGTDHGLFIPSVYKDNVVDIIGRLFELTFSRNKQQRFLQEYQNEIYNVCIERVGTYEYNVYKTLDGHCHQAGNYVDRQDRSLRGFKLQPLEFLDILVNATINQPDMQSRYCTTELSTGRL